MFFQLELFLLGVATVFDTVLLLIVLERVNRPQIASWLYALLFGLWLVHGASFVHELLRDMPSTLWASQLMVFLTCVGLLLLPSAMLHASLWLNFGQRRQQWRYLALYMPMVTLPWIAWRMLHSQTATFIGNVQPMATVYLTGVVAANLVSMTLFYRVRHQLTAAGASRFIVRLTCLLGWMTLVLVAYYSLVGHPGWEAGMRLVLILAPLLPAVLFVWHALNQRLLPLVMERTLLYGATVVIVLFLHRLLIEPIASSVQARAKVDILMVEGWLLIAIILAWPPLRCRFREAVRYLLSSNVHQIREATRRLSIEMSQLQWQSIDELLEWMASALKGAVAVDSVVIALEQSEVSTGILETVTLCSKATSAAATTGTTQELAASINARDVNVVYAELYGQSQPFFDRGQSIPADVERSMIELGMMWAFRIQFRTVRGLVLLGPRVRNDRLADEQLNSLSLLFEQFAATLHNRQLEQQRLRIERRAMQQDKLSTLGLLAGSLAHELRNPLSSMRTIASLMLEELGPQAEHARDVSLILAEIDRLTQTTTRLLDFARPASDQPDSVEPDQVLTRLLSILEHLARQRGVSLEVKPRSSGTRITASDASLTEILFNLIKNAIEAAGSNPDSESGGRVLIETRICDANFCCTVSDNGAGITAEMQAAMFEPFVTAKADGTGLGLYIVGQRVRELEGTIRCNSQPGAGTQFEVMLPHSKESLPTSPLSPEQGGTHYAHIDR